MKNKWISIPLITIGLLLVGMAVFADQMGLDRNTSWGRGRIVVFVLGLLMILTCTVLANFRKFQTLFIGQPVRFPTNSASLTLLVFGIVTILAYVWFVSLGLWNNWPSTTNFYDQLARAFQEGHLYLDITPNPALLNLPDPYEPDARQAVKGLGIQELANIWDKSVYKDRVYLYWGPAPALLLVMTKLIYSGEIGDQYLTFIFMSGLFIVESLFLLRIWRRFFNKSPVWVFTLALPLVAFISPIPGILTIPRIYEAAIVSDQFFFIGGLYFAFSSLDRPTTSVWLLACAGAFWALAFGSRATMALPISFAVLMTIFGVLGRYRSRIAISENLRALAALIMPMAVAAVGLGWYNLARFGSVFEFGFRYAITMLNQRKFYSVLFSTSYIFPNLYLYLLNRPSFTTVFPFLRPEWNGDFISNFNRQYHTIYNAEKITGLIYSAPFLLFALIPVFVLASDFIRSRAFRRKDTGLVENEDRERFFNWLLNLLVGALALELLMVLLTFYATTRYFMDVIPTLALLSTIGFWQVYQRFERRPAGRLLYIAAAFLLIIISIVVSFLLAFSSDTARIRSYNPGMLPHLKLFFIHLLRFLGK